MTDVFVARQPIFDDRGEVYAYELLFRSGPENYCPPGDADTMSSSVISDGISLMGFDALIGKRRAFLNFSRTALVNDFASLLPPERVVVEVLETVEPDDEVVAAVRRVKDAGFEVALDDFASPDRYAPLLDLVDYVKVDFLATTDPAERAALARDLLARDITLLAEKVETRDDVEQALVDGYRLFQGYFFARPTIIPARDVPGFRLNYLRLLAQINNEEASLDDLEAIMKQEVSMAFRLLRYINSAAFGLQTRATSIRRAMILLGLQGIRKLASVWAVAGLGRDRPAELVVTSTTRARFCENVARAAGLEPQAQRAFLVGMFSLLDAIVGRPLSDVIEHLPLGGDERAALEGRDGPLRRILDCAIAYERGEWDACLELGRAIGLEDRTLADAYLEAITWSRQIFLA